jgi:hypothetical protein
MSDIVIVIFVDFVFEMLAQEVVTPRKVRKRRWPLTATYWTCTERYSIFLRNVLRYDQHQNPAGNARRIFLLS